MAALPNGSSPAVSLEHSVRSTANSGWTAANTPRSSTVWEEHDAKRRRLDAVGGYQTPYRAAADDTPTRKTLSVSEMGGGLSGSPATAATHDPTRPPPSQPARVDDGSVERAQGAEPAPPPASGREQELDDRSPASSKTPDAENHHEGASASHAAQAASGDDEDSSDDEDIPSTLPVHIRQSLTPGNNTTGITSGVSGSS